MKSFNRSFLLGVVLATLISVSVSAQVTTTTLSGTIADPSGAAVPGAKVTVTNTDTGLNRTVTSNSTGNYVVADLPYGQYDVKVVKEGFNALNRTGIVLSLGTRQTLDLSLTLGSVTQAVTVSGQATLLKTRDASLGQAIGSTQIEALPVLGRSFDELMYLIPGSQVSPTGQYSGVSFIASAGPAIGVSFNGMRTEMNDYVLDGTETTYPIFGTPTFYPSLETLQEFRVETQNFSSEMSRTAGGQVMLYTKSGSNELHGSVYDYLRNDNLEARNPFSPTKPESKSNLFGATVGGPIKANNTFFFAGYEGFRAVIPGTSSTTVPTQDDRNGVLTDPVLHPNPIIDPTTGQPFQGNIIPADRIDPIAANILKLAPGPNVPGFPNYVADTSTSRPFDQYNVRIDHNFGSFGRLFGRWSRQNSDNSAPAFVVLNPSSTHGTGTNIVVGFDASSSVFFNSVRFGYTASTLISPNILPAGVTPQSLGFPLNDFQANPLGDYFGIPNFQIQNYAVGFNGFGQSGGTPGGDKSSVYQIADSMTYIRGNHTLRWGGDYSKTSVFNIFSGTERGVYTFDGTYTGDPMADFLLGLPRNLDRAVATPTPTFNSNGVHGFFSDTWKARPDLTLDLGLAYAYNGQPYEITNKIQSFFIGPVDGVQRIQFVFGGDPRFPRSLMFANTKNFDPRIGIAWQPFGSKKTVIRAGAGIFHSFLTYNDRLNNAFGPPFGVDQGFQNPNPPVATLENAFLPQLIGGATSTSRGLAAPMDFKDGTVYMWNLNIQREFGHGFLAQVGYVGNRAIHLDIADYFNAAAPGPGDFAPRRPYPLDPGPIFYGTTNANSSYNALQARLEKQFSHGLTFLSYYTWAQHLDNATALADGFGGQYLAQDINNIKAEWGPSSDNAHNRFETSVVYELPVGRGKSLLSNSSGVVDGILGGWRISGLVTLMGGMPWSASQPGNRSNTDIGDKRPDRICDGNLGSARTLSRWFDTSCYVLSPLYQFGNAGRDTIWGPGLTDFDASVAKDFRITERMRFQFRSDFYNLSNTPYFGKPDRTVGSATFGAVTGLARGGGATTRIIDFALKLVF